MTQAMTVAALNGLSEGAKAPMGRGVYARRNRDHTVTATLRIKRAGKSVDLPVLRVPVPVTKKTIAEIYARAERVRESGAAQVTPQRQRASLAAGATVEAVWADFLAAVDAGGKWTPRNRKSNVDRVTKYLAEWSAWRRPLAELTPSSVADFLRPVRAATPAQERKVRGLLSLICVHAMTDNLVTTNVASAAGASLRNTSRPASKRHFPTVLDAQRLAEIFRAIEHMTGEASVRNALKLQAFTVTRTGEVAAARWGEFNLDAGVWRIPRERMKTKDVNRGPHQIHLPPEAVAWLRTLPRKGELLFPGRLDAKRHVSLDALSKAMRLTLGLGGQFVPHSWRSALSTLARRAVDAKDGRPLFLASWIEVALDHETGDEVQSSYDRGQHYEQAGRVLAWWAGMLTASARGAT